MILRRISLRSILLSRKRKVSQITDVFLYYLFEKNSVCGFRSRCKYNSKSMYLCDYIECLGRGRDRPHGLNHVDGPKVSTMLTSKEKESLQ